MGKICDKTYLVTGGAGFLGAGLVRRLVKEQARVIVLDNCWRGRVRRLEGLPKGSYELIEGDIRDKDLVERAAKGVDCILHLAYINGTEHFYNQPELVLDVAVRGMLNVIDACRKHSIGEMIVASSSEVYQTPPQIPTAEEVPLIIPDIHNPRYSYGGGKILCELMSINYGRTGFERVVLFRPHNVYGPDMGFEHVVPQFILRLASLIEAYPGQASIDFPIQDDGKQTRAFIYIDDFVDGIMRLIESGKHLGIYHVGTQEEITIGQLAESVAAAMDQKINLIPGKPMEGATLRRCPDITALSKMGFNPTTTMSAGIRSCVEWYCNNKEHWPKL